MNALDVAGVTIAHGGRAILRDASFTVPAGAVCALVGRNGAGKTTLLRAMTGLHYLSQGSISIGGVPVRLCAPPLATYLAQEQPLYGTLRPGQVFGYAAAMHDGFDPRFAASWIERFDVPDDRQCARLSGGQRTQVALAAVLARDAPLCLLDEPMSMLDPVSRVDVGAELASIAASTGRAFIVSSHVLGDLAEFCDHVIVLAGGTVALAGPASEVADGTGRDLERTVLEVLRATAAGSHSRSEGRA